MTKPTPGMFYDWIKLRDWLVQQPTIQELLKKDHDCLYDFQTTMWPEVYNGSLVNFQSAQELEDDGVEISETVRTILSFIEESFPDITYIHYWYR